MVLSCDAARLDTAAQPDTAPGLPDSDSSFSLGPGPVSTHRSLLEMELAAFLPGSPACVFLSLVTH